MVSKQLLAAMEGRGLGAVISEQKATMPLEALQDMSLHSVTLDPRWFHHSNPWMQPPIYKI